MAATSAAISVLRTAPGQRRGCPAKAGHDGREVGAGGSSQAAAGTEPQEAGAGECSVFVLDARLKLGYIVRHPGPPGGALARRRRLWGRARSRSRPRTPVGGRPWLDPGARACTAARLAASPQPRRRRHRHDLPEPASTVRLKEPCAGSRQASPFPQHRAGPLLAPSLDRLSRSRPRATWPAAQSRLPARSLTTHPPRGHARQGHHAPRKAAVAAGSRARGRRTHRREVSNLRSCRETPI